MVRVLDLSTLALGGGWCWNGEIPGFQGTNPGLKTFFFFLFYFIFIFFLSKIFSIHKTKIMTSHFSPIYPRYEVVLSSMIYRHIHKFKFLGRICGLNNSTLAKRICIRAIFQYFISTAVSRETDIWQNIFQILDKYSNILSRSSLTGKVRWETMVDEYVCEAGGL